MREVLRCVSSSCHRRGASEFPRPRPSRSTPPASPRGGLAARDPCPRPAKPPRGEAGGQASYGTDSAHREAEVGAVGGSPVATGGPPRRGEASVERDGGDAAVVGLALRFALKAPPYGLRRASLRARPTTRTRTKTKNKKRDNSNEVRKGTFLKSFDSAATAG